MRSPYIESQLVLLILFLYPSGHNSSGIAENQGTPHDNLYKRPAWLHIPDKSVRLPIQQNPFDLTTDNKGTSIFSSLFNSCLPNSTFF